MSMYLGAVYVDVLRQMNYFNDYKSALDFYFINGETHGDKIYEMHMDVMINDKWITPDINLDDKPSEEEFLVAARTEYEWKHYSENPRTEIYHPKPINYRKLIIEHLSKHDLSHILAIRGHHKQSAYCLAFRKNESKSSFFRCDYKFAPFSDENIISIFFRTVFLEDIFDNLSLSNYEYWKNTSEKEMHELVLRELEENLEKYIIKK